MEEKRPPLDREEFKLITQNERKYIENPTDFIKEYKSPDAMARQYNNRIKYRTINAIHDILFVTENLSKEQLEKIFVEEHIEELFKITEKSLAIAKKRNPEKKQVSWLREGGIVKEEISVSTIPESQLRMHLRELLKYIMIKDQLDVHEALKKEYFNNPEILQIDLMELKANIGSCLQENKKLVEFIEKRGLKDEYEIEKRKGIENESREALRTAGWTEDKISEYLKKRYPD